MITPKDIKTILPAMSPELGEKFAAFANAMEFTLDDLKELDGDELLERGSYNV